MSVRDLHPIHDTIGRFGHPVRRLLVACAPARYATAAPIRGDAGSRRAGEPSSHRPVSCRSTARPGAGALSTFRTFRRGERGGVAIETALALVVLVLAFAVLMEIVSTILTTDRLGRAARAAAHAIALDPSADACAAMRRELGLAEGFDCDATWTVTVDRGVDPTTLPATLDASVTGAQGTGDMVLVRIGWSRRLWSFGGLVPDARAADVTGTVTVVAMGLARCEVERCGQPPT